MGVVEGGISCGCCLTRSLGHCRLEFVSHFVFGRGCRAMGCLGTLQHLRCLAGVGGGVFRGVRCFCTF